MNKVELINAVAAKAEISKKDADKAVTAVLSSITDALVAGEKVQLIGFGTFEVKERAARAGHNPLTGESIEAVCAEMEGKGYGELKARTSDVIIAALDPLQAEYKRLIADKQYLLDTLLAGAERANYIATKTLRKVQKKIGFAPRSLK